MGLLGEKVSYLKGLVEGMQIKEDTNEGKVIRTIVDTLDDFAKVVDRIEEEHEKLKLQVDEIDEDLADVESTLYGFDEDEEECFMEVECPYCKETICIECDEIDEEKQTIECPNCHREFEIDWEDECDCEEGHEHSEE